ncbi:HepT-like ribonuclease domain-containing protein [uncultured Thiodictyon sp.]|uniref:HepT-like ribonuclease domain-containing protein n=1 Tax=uncultured Thiodictyon sp. TaxID=1846217 RepID=UPI0025E06CF6|nr:HepT-like ribonuclease domain-containing protein [uncultured Thiodictyon sp.]
MSSRGGPERLADIREAIDRIAGYVGAMSYEEFLLDNKTQDAVIRNIEIIGEAAKSVSHPAFAGRVLPVDTAVARSCARLHVPAPRPLRDSFIAATALVHGMTVVTRNVRDFEPSGVSILDPWGWGL